MGSGTQGGVPPSGYPPPSQVQGRTWGGVPPRQVWRGGGYPRWGTPLQGTPRLAGPGQGTPPPPAGVDWQTKWNYETITSRLVLRTRSVIKLKGNPQSKYLSTKHLSKVSPIWKIIPSWMTTQTCVNEGGVGAFVTTLIYYRTPQNIN